MLLLNLPLNSLLSQFDVIHILKMCFFKVDFNIIVLYAS
jgi:hypothetical protein